MHARPGTTVAAVSRITDALDIFVADVNGAVQAAAWEPGFPGWTSWHQIPGVQTVQGATVTAVKRNTNYVDLFLTDDKHRIQTTSVFPAFGGWGQISGGVADPGATVSGISRRTDRLDVFVKTASALWTAGWEPGMSNWTSWRTIPNNFGPIESGAVSAVSRSLDKIDLYAVGLGWTVWSADWEPAFGNTWSVFPIPLPIVGHP